MSTTSSKRTPVPKLNNEIEEVEKLQTELSDLLGEDLTDLGDDIEKLQTRFKELREAYKLYNKKAEGLSKRYAGLGCMAESEEVRTQCITDTKAYHFIRNKINLMLREKSAPSLHTSSGSKVRAWLKTTAFSEGSPSNTSRHPSEENIAQGGNIEPPDAVDIPPPRDPSLSPPSAATSSVSNPTSTAPAAPVNTSGTQGQAIVTTSATSHVSAAATSVMSPAYNSTLSHSVHALGGLTSSFPHMSGHVSLNPYANVYSPPYPHVYERHAPPRVTFNASPQFAPSPIYSGEPPPSATTHGMPSTDACNSTDSVLKVVSKHLLQQDMMKEAIPTFDGNSIYFWSWVANISNYAEGMGLTPLQTLRLMVSHTSGRANEYLNNRLLALGIPSKANLDEIWAELIQRHGSSQAITAQLRQKIQEFPFIKNQNDGDNLLKLYDLCDAVDANMTRCPELQDMNLSTG